MQPSVTSCYIIIVCCVRIISFVAITLRVSSHDPPPPHHVKCSPTPYDFFLILRMKSLLWLCWFKDVPEISEQLVTALYAVAESQFQLLLAVSIELLLELKMGQQWPVINVHVYFVIDSVWGPLCMLLYDCHTCSSILCTTLVTEMSTWLISVLPWALFQVIVHHQAHPQLQVGVNLALETSLRISSSA
jgi:hypothetical protein